MKKENLAQESALKGLLLATSAVAAFASMSGVAFAQQAPPAPPAAVQPTAGGLSEIVVTAERREGTLQRTPAAVELIGSATLQNQRIVQFTDLNSVLNNAQIVPVNLATQVSIRGIGSNFVDSRADPGVATSINGLFYSRPLPLGFGFMDLARVEVLEGPQGTLYGRNAASGAVNIVTNQPTSQFGGMAQVTLGNLNEREFTGVVNIPITDTLAVRVAYDRDLRDGYVSDYFNDKNSSAGRIIVKWTPLERLKLSFETDYVQLAGHGFSPTSYPCTGSRAWVAYVPANCSEIPPGGGPAGPGNQGSYLGSDQLRADYDFNLATLTSITGYVGTHERIKYPEGSLFGDTYTTDNYDYSEELRLAGHDNANHKGGLAWQVGTFLFDSTGDSFAHEQSPTSNAPPTGTQFYSKLPQNSEAVYAQATYGLTDRLRLTGGIRYTHDSKGISYTFLTYLPPFFTTQAPPTSGMAKYSGEKVTYKGGIEYDLAPGKLLYGTISTGYVSGGVNGGSPTAALTPTLAPAVFQPETITAYEIGSKNRFFDNRLQLNASAYYYDFKNYQYLIPARVQGGGTGTNVNIQNAASVTAYGLELTGEFAATPNDRLSASLAFTHATFGALQFAAFIPPATAIETTVPSGSDVVNDPKWSALVGYNHTWPLKDNSSITFGINSKFSARYLLVVASTAPSDFQKGYAMSDANLAYHWGDNKYQIRAWVKNIENVPVNLYGQSPNFYLYGIAPPRTYGVTLSANF